MGSLRSTITFIATLLTLTTQAHAATEAAIDMICVTEMPTTSFIVKQEKEMVDILIYHHNGSQYAPVSKSLLTPNDVDFLKDQAQMVEKLGNRLEFKWKRSGCNADSADFFQCVGEAVDFEANGIKVHPWALTVSELTEKNMWGTYNQKNVNLRFSVDGKNYQITMDYQPGDCVGSSAGAAFQAKKKILNLNN